MASTAKSMEVRETEAKREDLESLKENGGGGAESCEKGGAPDPPTNPMVSALLTDMYQISMAYAYWKAGKHKDRAVYVFAPSFSRSRSFLDGCVVLFLA
jgi:hypothetical protein